MPQEQPTFTFTLETLQSFMRMTIETQTNQLVQAITANQVVQMSRNLLGTTDESKYLRGFQKYNRSSFDGGNVDPVAAEAWLEAIEKSFQYMNCPEAYRVHGATYMLQEEPHFFCGNRPPKLFPLRTG